MKKERIIAAVMTVIMTVCLFAGCNRNKTPWQDEAKTLVAEKMDETNIGQFVIDGVKYEFPMAVKDFTDNGWKFSSESVGTTNVSAFTWHPNYITLKSANNKSIEIGVYNNTEESSTIAESTVGEVRISNLRGNAMISGGIDFYGTTFAANGDLGEHAADGFELELDTVAGNGNVFTKDFTGWNGKTCMATFYFSEFKDNIVLGEIKYECTFEIPYSDAAIGMILAVIKNDPSKVEDLDSTVDGQSFIDDARTYLAEDFVYSLGFELESLTDEQYAKVYAIMDAIYAQTNFTVEAQGYNTLVVFNAPSNLVDVLNAAFGAATEAYGGDIENAASDAEYLNLVLDSFKVEDLEFMPGNSVVVTSGNFTSDVYDVLYYMLGFYDGEM